mgnify:CR=1 FL=1
MTESGQETVCKELGWEREATDKVGRFPETRLEREFFRKGTPQTILL